MLFPPISSVIFEAEPLQELRRVGYLLLCKSFAMYWGKSGEIVYEKQKLVKLRLGTILGLSDSGLKSMR